MEYPQDLIGRRLRTYREKKHMTQAALASKANVNHTYIGQIERGEKNITMKTAWKLTKALGITMSELFANIDVDDKGTQSIASKCYDLMLEHTQSEQEKLFRVMEGIFEYGK